MSLLWQASSVVNGDCLDWNERPIYKIFDFNFFPNLKGLTPTEILQEDTNNWSKGTKN